MPFKTNNYFTSFSQGKILFPDTCFSRYSLVKRNCLFNFKRSKLGNFELSIFEFILFRTSYQRSSRCAFVHTKLEGFVFIEETFQSLLSWLTTFHSLKICDSTNCRLFINVDNWRNVFSSLEKSSVFPWSYEYILESCGVLSCVTFRVSLTQW